MTRSSLSNLINIKNLELSENRISDIYSLILNNEINNGDTVNLSQNPLSETSKNTYIPELQARGATVYYSTGKGRGD